MTARTQASPQSTSGAGDHDKPSSGFPFQSIKSFTCNSAAVIGTLIALALVLLSLRSDWRNSAEQHLLGWLLERQENVIATVDQDSLAEVNAADRATAAQPTDLPKAQANVAFWLSRKYRVAPEPLSVLVAEAFAIGQRIELDPTLILAVMAIESRFNPFAQSAVGAQGLMQVMTRVHTDKYEDFGGKLAAFDPISNLRVGVQVLQDCIKRAGSVEGGLRLYVGAVTSDGSWYIEKVMAEHQRIQSVAKGKAMTTTTASKAYKRDSQPKTSAEQLETEAIAPALSPTILPVQAS